MKKKNKKNGFAVKLLAIILAVMMVVGIAFYTIYLAVQTARSKKSASVFLPQIQATDML